MSGGPCPKYPTIKSSKYMCECLLMRDHSFFATNFFFLNVCVSMAIDWCVNCDRCVTTASCEKKEMKECCI